jgi:5-enolpyruvylshikimate-3-phosphate synthase
MTLVALRNFGGDAGWTATTTIAIDPAPLHARDYTIEPDASAASYLLALPAIHGGSVTDRRHRQRQRPGRRRASARSSPAWAPT